MKTKITRVDLRKTRDRWPENEKFEPALMVPQKAGQIADWLIADAPIFLSQPLSLASALGDSYVRIPLFKYELSGQADVALAQMVQLGLSCAAQMPAEIEELHLATGDTVDLVYNEDGTRCEHLHYWFGLAFVLKEGVHHG